ncbi:hypothetical protein K2173_004886 [Erythroxylum novogranatense]|uniref:CCHC-type domain-containing protein n=1 Tax=Erythroxylum novogranatense TaxID=1862640 RepID=A0AAV8U8F0_9ROSI|nr:hypothetical protein K2173_004886 [Erythroxylum novogranatense]
MDLIALNALNSTRTDVQAAKKVRIRERDEDPPPPPRAPQSPPLSYRVVVTGPSDNGTRVQELDWPEDDVVELNDRDIAIIQGQYDLGIELSTMFKSKLDQAWATAVITKLMGRQLSFSMLKTRLMALWKPKGPIKLVDLDNEFYLVNFKDEDDYIRTLTQGPWIIAGQALSVQRWYPSFHPSIGKITHVVAWVRFPELSVAQYHPSILTALGNLVGRTVKINSHAQLTHRGKFARVTVYLDLSAPLRAFVELDGEPVKVAYEGLPPICFHCGLVGHGSENCPSRTPAPTVNEPPTRRARRPSTPARPNHSVAPLTAGLEGLSGSRFTALSSLDSLSPPTASSRQTTPAPINQPTSRAPDSRANPKPQATRPISPNARPVRRLNPAKRLLRSTAPRRRLCTLMPPHWATTPQAHPLPHLAVDPPPIPPPQAHTALSEVILQDPTIQIPLPTDVGCRDMEAEATPLGLPRESSVPPRPTCSPHPAPRTRVLRTT